MKMNCQTGGRAELLKVLSAGTRVRILEMLKGRALCVNALAVRLNVTQGAVSQHLRIMHNAGLLLDEKRGTYVHYRLNEAALARGREEVNQLLDPNQRVRGNREGEPRCVAAKTAKKAAANRSTSGANRKTARRNRSGSATAT
jgi:DNA-binding transcriptional ArsR family regulator